MNEAPSQLQYFLSTDNTYTYTIVVRRVRTHVLTFFGYKGLPTTNNLLAKRT